jgi:microcystin-dependent protein
MSEPFVGEIRMFAGNFAPRGWALCDGQLLAISQNDALFSLLGTIYGGDGRTTFGLPELRGRIPIHAGSGSGPGLTTRALGAKSGSETNTLAANQVPAHSHNLMGTTNFADDSSPVGKLPAVAAGANLYKTGGANQVTMDDEMIAPAGNTSPSSHKNVMPFLCLNFIIALFGIYPSRN